MSDASQPRRVFLLRAMAGGGLLSSGALQAQTRVEEADESAVALGYKHDTTKVDAKKYPAHKADQKCNNCQFWQGAATDAWAGCAMFGRKQIAAAGWCLAYKKIG
jgi:High potential iron-sulfur protein